MHQPPLTRLWAKDLTTGGLTGGLWGDGQVPASSESGDAYEGKFSGSIIMNGILYYNTAQLTKFLESKQLTYIQEKNFGSKTTQHYHSAKFYIGTATT